MSWREALTEYSKINNQYVIPKKGTKQYDEVKAIQDTDSGRIANTQFRCLKQGLAFTCFHKVKSLS